MEQPTEKSDNNRPVSPGFAQYQSDFQEVTKDAKVHYRPTHQAVRDMVIHTCELALRPTPSQGYGALAALNRLPSAVSDGFAVDISDVILICAVENGDQGSPVEEL